MITLLSMDNNDSSGFYPSDSWAVAIDGFLELGGVVHEQGQDDDITLPWAEKGNERILLTDTLLFGSRRVSATYIPVPEAIVGPPYSTGQVMLWPRVHWLGGDRDFSDQAWKWIGEVVRGDAVGTGEMDNTWKEQILDAPGWREYRSNWDWAHCPLGEGPRLQPLWGWNLGA